jgi:RNA polymerase sigma factor (sigma-70 family)
MAGDTESGLRVCLARLRAGDPDARTAVIAGAQQRLQWLAQRQMRRFERLRRFEDADDVVQNATLRLFQRLDAHAPANPAELFAWAAREIRCELLDLVKHYYGARGAGRRESTSLDADSATHAGAQSASEDHLAWWQEFHEQVERLPVAERCAFELHWYHGMTWPQAAAVLNMSEATVKRHWRAARLRLQSLLKPDGTEF